MSKFESHEYMKLMKRHRQVEQHLDNLQDKMNKAEDELNAVQEEINEAEERGGIDFDYIRQCDDTGLI